MDGIGGALGYLSDFILEVKSGAWTRSATWVLGFVFLWSGTAKLPAIEATREAIGRFRVVREPTRVHAISLSITEIAIGASLVAGFARALALIVASFALLLFSILVVAAVVRGEKFECNCFGPTGTQISWRTAARTLSLCALASVLLAGASDPVVSNALAVDLALALGTLGAVATASLLPPLLRESRQTSVFIARFASAGSGTAR